MLSLVSIYLMGTNITGSIHVSRLLLLVLMHIGKDFGIFTVAIMSLYLRTLAKLKLFFYYNFNFIFKAFDKQLHFILIKSYKT